MHDTTQHKQKVIQWMIEWVETWCEHLKWTHIFSVNPFNEFNQFYILCVLYCRDICQVLHFTKTKTKWHFLTDFNLQFLRCQIVLQESWKSNSRMASLKGKGQSRENMSRHEDGDVR